MSQSQDALQASNHDSTFSLQDNGQIAEKDNHQEFVDGEEDPDSIDYNRLYEELQAQFHESYAISQKLFLTERTQRQALYYHKRRIDALLDYLGELEEDKEPEHDRNQILNIIQKKPHLEETLLPLLDIESGKPPSQIPLKQAYNIDLATEEMIPGIANDELDSAELNPQNTEMWVRRNYSYLVVSKFKPLDIRARGVREYLDVPLQKKKRRTQ